MAGRITGDESLEELQDLVAKLQKDVNWLLDGNLSSKNVREIGGYQVSSTLFQSKDSNVGLSSANDAPDPVRFWAGSVNKDAAPWRVHKSGKSVMTGALIQSKDGEYPYVKMDPASDLFGAYGSATQSIIMRAFNGGTNSPYFLYKDGLDEASIYLTFGEFNIWSTVDLGIYADLVKINCDDIYLNPSGRVNVGFHKIYDSSLGENLLDALMEKAKANISTGFSGGHNHGISDTEYIQVYDSGGSPTRLHRWSAAAQHTHAQLS